MMLDATLSLTIAIITLLACLHRAAEYRYFRRPYYFKILFLGSLISLFLILPKISSGEEALYRLVWGDHLVPIMFGPLVLGCLAQACLTVLRFRWPRLLSDYFQYSFFTVLITGSSLVYTIILWYLVLDRGYPTI